MSKHEQIWANRPGHSNHSQRLNQPRHILTWFFHHSQRIFSMFFQDSMYIKLVFPGWSCSSSNMRCVTCWSLGVWRTGCCWWTSLAAVCPWRPAPPSVPCRRFMGKKNRGYIILFHMIYCVYIYIYGHLPHRGLPWVFLVVFAVKHIYFIVQLLVWFTHYHTSTVQFNSCFLAVPQLPPGYSTS